MRLLASWARTATAPFVVLLTRKARLFLISRFKKRYTLTVSDQASGACWWKTTHRFSDFEKLAKDVGDAELAKCIPKKGWGIGTSKLKQAESRVGQLNEFVTVLQQSRLMHHPAVVQFFDAT
jgi:hypothetical protein